MGARRLKGGAWLLALVCGLWLGWPRPLHAQFFSPGELARGHASLAGDDRCSECHSAGRGVSNDKCMSCHQDVARTVREKTGLHGKTFAGQPCGSCHVDHRGRDHDLIRWDPQSFDHRQAGWPLRGDHARLACAKCHTGKNERGHATYIGLDQACVSCHEDKHQGRFGLDCQSCHDEVDWKNLELDRFDHALSRFPLRGKHAQVKCAECHGTPAVYQPLPFAECGDCHEDPHQERLGSECESCHDEVSWKKTRMTRGAHPGVSLGGGHTRVACKSCHDRGNLLPPSRGERCVSCHEVVHDAKFGDDCARCHTQVRWLGLPEALGRRVHRQTRYPLVGGHQRTPCKSCHSEKLPRAQRYRDLDFDACMDCHKDVHRGQFSERSGGACESCHDVQAFAPASFGAEEHATTELALVGSHEAAPCQSCHTGKAPRLDWQLDKQTCADCHKNPHGDRFEREMAADGCATCHGTVAWDLPKIEHDSWPLLGKHASARCDECHTATEADQRAGAGPSYKLAPRECEGCHTDVHLGQFRLSEPEKECGACHDAQSFQLPDFDHVRGTGYALEGKHAKLACAACHVPTQLTDGRTTPLWRLPYDECKDCHQDPHVEAKR